MIFIHSVTSVISPMLRCEFFMFAWSCFCSHILCEVCEEFYWYVSYLMVREMAAWEILMTKLSGNLRISSHRYWLNWFEIYLSWLFFKTVTSLLPVPNSSWQRKFPSYPKDYIIDKYKHLDGKKINNLKNDK